MHLQANVEAMRAKDKCRAPWRRGLVRFGFGFVHISMFVGYSFISSPCLFLSVVQSCSPHIFSSVSPPLCKQNNNALVSFHQTDVVFLEREVKTRKQKFGVEIYDLMAQLEVDDGMSVDEKEGKIRLSFDQARKDISVIQAKIDSKKEEMTKTEVVDAIRTSGAPGVEIPADHQPAAATIVTE